MTPKPFDVAVDDDVAIVMLDDGENRLDTSAIGQWLGMLDAVEANRSIGSLVVASTGKHWSTGLDLDEIGAMTTDASDAFMHTVDALLGRLLTFPVVTVAALNGHTFAAGALLALCFDYRVMRADRGYFCLPSVDVGISFSSGMSALIAAKLPQPIAHDLVVSGRRIGGEHAAAAGAVHRAVAEAHVRSVALDIAREHGGKDRATLSTNKRRMYPTATDLLAGTP